MKKVKEVCMIAGISKRTLQYYDDEGILPAERSDGNERLYSEEALRKLMHLLVYKKLGLKLEQIRLIIDASEQSRNEILQRHIDTLLNERNVIGERILFTEHIISNGMPDLTSEETGENEMTYMEQLERVERGVVK